MFRADQQHKILVVDDDEIVLEVTRAALESAGHHVVTHDRAAGCVALILQECPDLVLMDVNLPHLSGDTVVGVLAKARPGGEIVVLLYSSLSADILRVKVESVGAQGFIQKTADTFSLVREVNRWLKRSAALSSGGMRAAKDMALRSSSSKLRAATELTAASNGKLRVGPRLTLPSNDDSRAAPVGSRAHEASAVALEPSEAISANSATMQRARTPRVLLIDRDMAVLSAYRSFLQSDQLTVEYALSAGAALRSILSQEPPDVAVCDALMSELPGIELYRRALASSTSWHARMVLTADVHGASGLREFKGQLLIKPISADALRNAVRACLAQCDINVAGRASAT